MAPRFVHIGDAQGHVPTCRTPQDSTTGLVVVDLHHRRWRGEGRGEHRLVLFELIPSGTGPRFAQQGPDYIGARRHHPRSMGMAPASVKEKKVVKASQPPPNIGRTQNARCWNRPIFGRRHPTLVRTQSKGGGHKHILGRNPNIPMLCHIQTPQVPTPPHLAMFNPRRSRSEAADVGTSRIGDLSNIGAFNARPPCAKALCQGPVPRSVALRRDPSLETLGIPGATENDDHRGRAG